MTKAPDHLKCGLCMEGKRCNFRFCPDDIWEQAYTQAIEDAAAVGFRVGEAFRENWQKDTNKDTNYADQHAQYGASVVTGAILALVKSSDEGDTP